MADSINRSALLRLLASILNGEEDATFVLADLLEEHGQRGVADGARIARPKNRKRFEFVVGLIPRELLLPLGCDYIEHILDRSPEAYAPYADCRAEVQRLRSWSEEANGADGLQSICDRLAAASAKRGATTGVSYARDAQRALWHLVDAAKLVMSWVRQETPERRRNHEAGRCRRLICRVAAAARSEHQVVRPRRDGDQPVPGTPEWWTNWARSRHGVATETEMAVDQELDRQLKLADWVSEPLASSAEELQWQIDWTRDALLANV